jgi:hypothetical protein
MSAAQGADRSGVADGALAHFGRPIADVIVILQAASPYRSGPWRAIAARRGPPDAISRCRYGLNRKCNAPDKAPVQPWSTSMLAEIFMLRLEEAAPHRPDHVAGCEGVLTRAAASARLLSARPGHAFGSSR